MQHYNKNGDELSGTFLQWNQDISRPLAKEHDPSFEKAVSNWVVLKRVQNVAMCSLWMNSKRESPVKVRY
jgi:hypothetical protein